MPGYTGPLKGLMTAREVMEYIGTKMFRRIKDKIWVEATLNEIRNDNLDIALLLDNRFPNEVEAIKSAGGIVIRLTRDLFNSNAMAECALDENVYDWSNFDIIIDNKNITLEQLCDKLQTLNSNWS
jgi:hypothetical protein